MSVDDGGQRLSVSRDALRAELAEMELRLRVFIETQMHGKADLSDMVELTIRVKELEQLRRARDRGELTAALEREVRALARAESIEASSMSWTNRGRFIAVLSVMVSVSMLILSIVLAVIGGGFG